MFQSNAIQISLIVFGIISSGLCHDIQNTTDSYTCKPEHKIAVQPQRRELSKVTKCCRIDENLYAINDTSTYNCNRHVYPTITVNIATVELFDDCITFWNRSHDLLPIEIINYPPDHLYSTCLYFGEMYGSHIIQNGSLLVTNTYGHFNYRLHNDYCLEVNAQTGAYMVCQNVEIIPPDYTPPHLARPYNTISKIFTIISMPCFVGITLLYLIDKNFRTLHGACVTSLSIFMTVEFLLQSILNYSKSEDLETLWKIIHYLSFVHYFWLLVIFTNGLLFVWIYLPYNILEWRPFGICSYFGFFLFCVTVPKFIADRIRNDELVTIVEFLTTPKTTIVLTCLLLLMLTFMGSNRLTLAFKQEIFQKYYKNEPAENNIDIMHYHFQIEEVQNRLTCLTSLAGFLVILRVFSMPGHLFLIFMREILNSLQGVIFIFIFIGLRFREIRNFSVCRFKN